MSAETFPENKVQCCAESYGKLVKHKVTYDIKIKTGSYIEDYIIKFDPEQFMHLTSMEKIADLGEISYKPKDFYRLAKKGVFSYNYIKSRDKFFDDTVKPNNKTEEEFDDEIRQAKKDGKVFESDLFDRLTALENIDKTMQIASFDKDDELSLKLYSWLRDVNEDKRPHNSKINADFLIEIYDKNNPDKPYINFFIIKNKDTDKFTGVSIFKSKYTYSDDTEKDNEKYKKIHGVGLGRERSEIEVLSVTETRLENGRWQETLLMTKDPEYVAECQKKFDEIKENERIEAEISASAEVEKMRKDPNRGIRDSVIDELNNKRNKIIKLETIKSKGKFSSGQEEKLSKKTKERYEFLKSGIYIKLPEISDLEKVKQILQEEKEKAKIEKPDAVPYIEYEIKAIDEYLKLREKISQLSSLREQGEDSLDEYSENIKIITNYVKNEYATEKLCQQISSMLDNQTKNSDSEIDEFFTHEESVLKQALENKMSSEKGNDRKPSEKGAGSTIITISDTDRESGRQALFQLSDGAIAIPKMPNWKDWFDNAVQSLKQTFSALKEKVTDLFRKKTDNPEGGDTAETPSAPDNPDTDSRPETAEQPDENNTDNFYYMGESGVLKHIGAYQKAGRELREKLHISIGWFKKAEQEQKPEKPEQGQQDYPDR